MSNPKWRLLALCALLATLSATTVHAQTRISQRWAAGSNTLADSLVYSPNGKYIAFASPDNVKLFSAVEGVFHGTLALPAVQAVAFSGNSALAYVAAGTQVVSVRALDALLPTVVVSDTVNIVRVAASKDLTKLAYVTEGIAAAPQLVVFNLTTSTELARVSLPSLPSEIAFTLDSTKVIVDGPDLYDATTGAVVLDGSGLAGKWALSKVGDAVVGRSVDGTKLESRWLADGSVRWSVPFPAINYTGGDIAVNNLGTRFMVPGRNAAGAMVLALYHHFNGNLMATQVVPTIRTDVPMDPLTNQVTVAASSATQLFTVSQDIPEAGGGYVVNEQYGLNADDTLYYRNELSGLSYPVEVMSAMKTNSPTRGFPLVAVGTTQYGDSPQGGIQVRNANTGAIIRRFKGINLAPNTPDALAMNPGGTRLAAITPSGVTFMNLDTQTVIGGVPMGATAVEFPSATVAHVAAIDGNIYKFTVGSTTVTPAGAYPLGFVTKQLAISRAVTYAAVTGPNPRDFTVMDLSTMAKSTKVLAYAGGQTEWVDWDLAGRVYIGYKNSILQTNIAKYSNTGGVLALVKVYSRTLPTDVMGAGYAVSPSGKFIGLAVSRPDGTMNRTNGDVFVWLENASFLQVWRDQQIGTKITGAAFCADEKGLILSRADRAAACILLPPAATGLSNAPDPVVGGNAATGTITLDGPAVSGMGIYLSSSNPAVASVPERAIGTPGLNTVTFPITTYGVDAPTTVTITVTTPLGVVTDTLEVVPATVASLTLPPFIWNVSTGTGIVTLNGQAGPSGLTVDLASDNAAADVMPSILVPGGATSEAFSISTSRVTIDTTVTISASNAGNTVSGTTLIKAIRPETVTFDKAHVYLGVDTSLTGTVTLAAPAALGGEVVSLSSDVAGATVPASITIPEGATTGTFTVTLGTVGMTTQVNVTATASGYSVMGAFTFHAGAVTNLVLTRNSVIGGESASGTVTISAPAPAGGLVVTLTSSKTAAQVPATITIAAGATTGTFTITSTPVAASTTAVITASFEGTSKTANLTVSKPR